MRKLTWWGKFLVLLVLNLALAAPAGAQPAGEKLPSAQPVGAKSPGAQPPDAQSAGPKPPLPKSASAKVSRADAPAQFTDYGSFLGEFQAAGAFKFYDNTEAILRLANFEQALMRYRFLKGQIQGKVDYHGLLASTNRRIQFLQKQLHLRDSEVAAIPARKVRMLKAKPAVKLPETKPPEKPGAAKPKTPGDADTEADKTKEIPVVSVTPSPPAQVPAASPLPGAQKQPPVVTTDAKAKEDEKAEEEKDKEESKPAVPPNFWQRMKIKLHLGKKPDNAG